LPIGGVVKRWGVLAAPSLSAGAELE